MRSLQIETAPAQAEADILHLARKHRLTFYDATYLQLAMREQLPLAKLDGELRSAARREGVELVAA